VEAGVFEAARLQVHDALARPRLHGRLRAEHDGAGRTGLHAGGLQSHRHPIRAQGALVGLAIHPADARDVERTAHDAIAAADAVPADEVDDAVGVLDNRARRRTGLQAARVLAVHAAVLADQPLKIALVVRPFAETHQRPGALVEIRRVVVGPLEVTALTTQVVRFHAGGLTGLAADAAADIDQLRHFELVVARRRRRQVRCRATHIVLGLQISHRPVLQATGPLVFSTLTRKALNSGVS